MYCVIINQIMIVIAQYIFFMDCITINTQMSDKWRIKMGLFSSKADASDSSKDIFSRIDKEASKADMMVNTLGDSDLAKLSAGMKSELAQAEKKNSITDKLEAELHNDGSTRMTESVVKEEPKTELEQISDETAVITAGLVVSGNLDSIGSIDIFGTVDGDVSCKGKLTVSGTITGTTIAKEVFANNAHITGDVEATGSAKIGQGTVVVGDITATSAVIAGAIKGNVDVNGPVIIDSSAIIVGDIKSKSVQINNGATINGRCLQVYADVDVESIFNIGSDNKDTKRKEAAPKEPVSKDTKPKEPAAKGAASKEPVAKEAAK